MKIGLNIGVTETKTGKNENFINNKNDMD